MAAPAALIAYDAAGHTFPASTNGLAAMHVAAASGTAPGTVTPGAQGSGVGVAANAACDMAGQVTVTGTAVNGVIINVFYAQPVTVSPKFILGIAWLSAGSANGIPLVWASVAAVAGNYGGFTLAGTLTAAAYTIDYLLVF